MRSCAYAQCPPWAVERRNPCLSSWFFLTTAVPPSSPRYGGLGLRPFVFSLFDACLPRDGPCMSTTASGVCKLARGSKIGSGMAAALRGGHGCICRARPIPADAATPVPILLYDGRCLILSFEVLAQSFRGDVDRPSGNVRTLVADVSVSMPGEEHPCLPRSHAGDDAGHLKCW